MINKFGSIFETIVFFSLLYNCPQILFHNPDYLFVDDIMPIDIIFASRNIFEFLHIFILSSPFVRPCVIISSTKTKVSKNAAYLPPPYQLFTLWVCIPFHPIQLSPPPPLSPLQYPFLLLTFTHVHCTYNISTLTLHLCVTLVASQ